MPTTGGLEFNPVTIAQIKAKAQEREYEVVDDPVGHIKLKNYTSAENETKDTELHPYYCGLCGSLAIITTTAIQKAPKRRTEKSIILNEEAMQWKSYMT